MKKWILFFFPVILMAQESIEGYVLNQESQQPIFGAVVLWENTNSATITDENGFFQIGRDSVAEILVVNYLGYQTRKFIITDEKQVVIELSPESNQLEEVDIQIEKPSTNISMFSTIKVEEMGLKALKKAACCNLSESFETNPTVDVSYSDAVTGAKQIQLLGLAGPYALISTANMPTITGNSSVTGLDFIPGQWLGSIQLIKGTGSVVNGYSSISGQINAEYKHFEDFKYFLNGYADASSRTEINSIVPYKVKKYKSGFFLQADNAFVPMDNNSDNFMDNQLGSKLVAMHLTRYENDSSNWESRFAIKLDHNNKEAGQMPEIENRYQFINRQDKIDAWAKVGYVFDAPGRSLGIQVHGFVDDKTLQFGNRTLIANEQKFYTNLLYSDIILNTNHSFKTGISYVMNDLDNQFDSVGYSWTEHVPGSFFEYSYVPNLKFSLVVGGRVDYSSLFGMIYTPRLHSRWEIAKGSVIRLAAGMGSKTPNPLLENYGVFASSREVIIHDMELERAVNFGGSFTQKWGFWQRTLTFSTDLYRTYFMNKLIMDYDINSKEIHFYSLENGSYANSIMTQIIVSPIEDLTLNLAYRWYDIQSKFNEADYSRQPLVSAHRAFANGEWQITKQWDLDYTIAWNGVSRIPALKDHPEAFQGSELSSDFWIHNIQLKYNPTEKWELYLGAENLFNYQQANPIIDAENPFGENFDASLVWAPVFGRKLYGGFRYEF